MGGAVHFKEASHFAVHILASDQEALSNQFATRGIDKFSGLVLERGENGIPLLTGCGARFQCRSAYQYEGGDHVIFVGEVVSFDQSHCDPLLFHCGTYALARQRKGTETASQSATLPDEDLTHLLQRSYFYLLTPVRKQRERHGISLNEHYLLNVLMSGGGHTLEQINDIIGYTGIKSTQQMVESLVERGLVVVESPSASPPRLGLSQLGQQIMIEVVAAGKAMEEDALLSFDETEKRLLKQLLIRFVTYTERKVDGPVAQHMDLMKRIVNFKSSFQNS